MRWERLFDDLEGLARQDERADWEARAVEQGRAELARVPLTDRLRGQQGKVEVLLLNGRFVRGTVEDVGPDWCVLRDGTRGVALVPTSGMLRLRALRRVGAPASAVAGGLGLAHVLRSFAQHRCPVTIEDRGGYEVAGTIDAVGADFLELAEHDPAQVRRAENVQAVTVVPFAALVAVTAHLPGHGGS